MKTRSIKDLLILLRNELPEYIPSKCYGLCSTIVLLHRHGIISIIEYNKLVDYFSDNSPVTRYIMPENSYWFCPGDIDSRLQWLNEQIEKL